ncbi:Sister chromatid cohesion protein pds5 [Lecanora helva]
MSTTATVETATETMEMEQEQDLPGLQFNEPLSWRAGKSIAVADLLRRLQALSKEMRGMEQEENERDSFTTVAKELASANLLGHKDKGVKAWTACCLVDILRLCAPDAPYTAYQLKDIFNLFVNSTIPALSDPSNAYNQQHLYVLNSLAQVKSIVLLTDIPSSEQLLTHLFVQCFDILAGSSKSSTGEQLGKNVEIHMTSLLIIMVEESANLPSEVVDVIVAQFFRTDPRAMNGSSGKSKKNSATIDEKQSTLVLKELPAAYNMARTICNSCPEKMANYFGQYFNDVILDASSSAPKAPAKKAPHRKATDNSDDSDLDGAAGPTEEDLGELRKAHLLLRELWRSCPAVLQNVIPQLEAELSAENVHLRSMATETLGDLISGIGAAGLAPPSALDPATYPPLTLSDMTDTARNDNILTKPSSPQRFSQAHPQAFLSFLGRNHDKSAVIRATWATGIGRILSTSAGGIGLSQQEEDRLVKGLTSMLQDADERVRIAAVKAIGILGVQDVVFKLGSSGGLDTPGSVLSVLADRLRDRKHAVRKEATVVLARLWGVAAGAMLVDEEQVISAIGTAPSIILNTFYTGDLEIAVLLDHVLYEQLLPLSYPPIKAKSTKHVNGESQKARDGQMNGNVEQENISPDMIRAERILLLVKYLDEKARKVFFSMQIRQIAVAKIMEAFLQRCEDYNGGVMDQNEKAIKEHLTRLISSFGSQMPDSSKAIESLWKFAKMHDRRSYQLIRFCMSPDSDYRTVVNAIKELTRRIEQKATSPQDLLAVLIPLLYRVSVIVYNKSHVTGIMGYSRTDDKSLASTAQETLKEISTQTPQVLKAHVKEICVLLQDEAPQKGSTNDPGALDNLRACASYASKYPDKIFQDRKFVQAMVNFALYGTPAEAGKHAVTIIMTSSEKKEMLAKDLVQKCIKDFQYGGEGFLSRLASLSQLMLLAPNEVEQESDAVSDIAIEEVLSKSRTTATDSSKPYSWSPAMDDECQAKCWALKILVNRVRSQSDPETQSEIAGPVYKVLLNLIQNDGELLPNKDTPSTHKPRLRLLAARLCLKLCTKQRTDGLLTPTSFNTLALIAQDPIFEVRSSFLQRLKKYLGHSKLPQRFYAIPFLLAFEPNTSLKSDTTTWLRSRAFHFRSLKDQQPDKKAHIVMVSIFARLLSLLAYHPDYASTAEDLIDFARYILFYLYPVATEENLSLIYHIAQRVKQSRDAIGPPAEYDSHLYYLSDLAQLTIRKFEEAHGWSIQTLPTKLRLPTSLYENLDEHEEAQQVAEKNFLPEGVEEGIDGLVKTTMKAARSQGKKRRSDHHENGEERGGKRVRSLTIRKAPAAKEKKPKALKTPKKPKRKSSEDVESTIERRRSGRATVTGGKYAERDDEEDDEEMAEGVATWEYADGKLIKDDDYEIDVDDEDEEGQEAAGQDDDADPEPEEEEEEIKKPSPKPPARGRKPVTKLKGAKKGR